MFGHDILLGNDKQKYQTDICITHGLENVRKTLAKDKGVRCPFVSNFREHCSSLFLNRKSQCLSEDISVVM